MRFQTAAAAFATSLAVIGCRPAHGFTAAEAQAYLLKANPTCGISAYPPFAAHVQGSDKELTVLRYGIEGCQGGNNHAVMIAALYDAGGGRIGSYDNRALPEAGDIESLAVKDGRILVAALAYGPSDARCCPSRKASYSVVVNAGKLVVER